MDFIHYPRIDACGMAEANHMKEFEVQDGRFPLSLFRELLSKYLSPQELHGFQWCAAFKILCNVHSVDRAITYIAIRRLSIAAYPAVLVVFRLMEWAKKSIPFYRQPVIG